MVEWCRLDDIAFTDPFFEMTLERAMRHPFRLLFRRRTSIEILEERAATCPGIPPTGFIFHMSRCGSTLIAQMLAASEANVAVSEGWPIESAIDAGARRWLVAMVRALGQPRRGGERRYFVKFDARHALDLPLVRCAFPEVPWIFVYRDPVEVLVSHLEQPTGWTVPGMVPVRGVPWPAADDGFGGYAAAVIAAICRAALDALEQPGGGMLLNYTDLPGAVFSTLAAHFGCEWTPGEIAAMRQAAARNAKRPGETFSPDSLRKQREAPPVIRESCERLLGDLYSRLETKRAGQPLG